MNTQTTFPPLGFYWTPKKPTPPRVLIVPLSKSNYTQGRVGPLRWQDCYLSMTRAADWLFSLPEIPKEDFVPKQRILRKMEIRVHCVRKVNRNATVLLMSSFKPLPEISPQSELQHMWQQADLNKIPSGNIISLMEGHDTQSQINIALNFAKKHGFEVVVFISTILHRPRVEWLSNQLVDTYPKIRIIHDSVIGIPRPFEAVSDIVFAGLYPLLDVCGQRKRFDAWMQSRRKKKRKLWF